MSALSRSRQLSRQEVELRRLSDMLRAAIERATKAEADAAMWKERWIDECADHEETIKHCDVDKRP